MSSDTRRQRPASARKLHRRLSIERLEDRRCLSTDVQLLNNLNLKNPWGKVTETVSAGDFVYFVALETNASQLDLWRTDGTISGTIRLSSVGPDNDTACGLTNVNGNLYFRGYDAEHGFELWNSDGSVTGTKLVRDQSPGFASSKLNNFVALGDQLLFTKNGNLMRSNGKPSGTVQVADFLPDAVDEVSQLERVGSSVYFKAKLSATEYKLFKTDGMSERTVPLRVDKGGFNHLTKIGDSLYFTRIIDDHSQLWKTAGETDSVQVVVQSFSNNAYEFTDVNGTMFFSDLGAIGRVEGNAAVTIKSIGNSAFNLFNMNGTLYFAGGTEFLGDGYELWKSDGTQAGTVMVKNIEPGFNEGYGFSSNPSAFTNLRGELFFAASRAIWTTDGTFEGTLQIESNTVSALIQHDGLLFFSKQFVGTPYFGMMKRDVSTSLSEPILRNGSGAGDANPSSLIELNGAYYFGASDGVLGTELWKYQPADRSTTLVKDIVPGSAGSNVRTLASINGLLYFSANDSLNTQGLWASDGTEAGTRFLRAVQVSPQRDEPTFTALGNTLFFRGYDSIGGYELWKTDGTVGGTMIVKDTYPGSTYLGQGYGFRVNSGSPAGLTLFNNMLYFSTYSPDTGRELWKSDGTVQGTLLVVDLYPGGYTYYGSYTSEFRPSSSNPRGLTTLRGKLHFVANVERGSLLWRSDGTDVGTLRYKNAGYVNEFERVGDELYFSELSYTVDSSTESLWKTDGTARGTIKIKDIRSSPSGGHPLRSMINAGGVLYFVANDGKHGNELWRSDGTATGTAMVSDIRTGQYPTTKWPRGSEPQDLTLVNGVMFFSADDGINGRELWRTNGTDDGVTLVSDILPGAMGSGPTNFSLLDGKLYFSASGKSGREVWVAKSRAPQISDVPVTVDYIQGDSAALFAPNAMVMDADTPTLRGGRLTIQISTPHMDGDELLIINRQDIQSLGNDVFYFSTLIGRIDPTSRGRFDINLNLNATLEAVTKLVQAIAYRSDLELPALQPRRVQIRLTDGEGAASKVGIVELVVKKVVVAPVLRQIDTSLEYSLNGPAVLIAPAARVIDVDSPNFGGGSLLITVLSGQVNSNRILIRESEFLIDADRNLHYHGLIIGKEVVRSDSVGLKVDFNDQATSAIVQRLLRSLAFSTVGSTTNGLRTITIVVLDGDGGLDNAELRVRIV